MNGYTLSVIDKLTDEQAPVTIGHFHDLVITSHFQPIFSLAHGRTVGHEALLRSTDARGKPVPPGVVFQMAVQNRQSVLLDRLCRKVHLQNFLRQSPGNTWLFLNVDPEVIQHGPARYGAFFRELLDTCQVAGYRIVIEMLETSLNENEGVPESIRLYRELGCLLAVDDFGAGHSNFDRIWRFKPEIVKLDISLVRQASRDPLARQIVSRIASALHESGALVVMEGVEDEQQAMIAMEADADFVQGYYFAKPAENLVETPNDGVSFRNLVTRYHRAAADRRRSVDEGIGPYASAITSAVELLRSGLPIELAVGRFLELPRAEFVYILDGAGYQLCENVVAPGLRMPAHPRFLPVAEALGANWSRRPYFLRAVARCGEVQITRPYLSVSSGESCITLSTAFELGGERRVLCADIGWAGEPSA